MKISGNGTIRGNDYNEEIHISGSGTIEGDISCTGLRASGSVKAVGVVICTGEINVSGSGEFKDVKASDMHVSGSVNAENLSVRGELKTSGSCKAREGLDAKKAHISGSLDAGSYAKFGSAEISGRFDCGGDAEAENFTISGPVYIKGLLNAENVEIRLGHGTFTNRINSIGGSNITVKIYNDHKISLFNIGRIVKTAVKETIEGDEIYLENTECPLVVGKNVYIGEGCKIGKVQYYNSCKTSEEAEVCKEEKI